MVETGTREQRRFRRYELRLPLEVVRAGSYRSGNSGETRNLSSGGVLFTAHSGMEVGEPIEYMITLHTGPGVNVLLHCRGKVVRLDQERKETEAPSNSSVAVAATLERYEFVRRSPHRTPILAHA